MFGTDAKKVSEALSKKLGEENKDNEKGVDLVGLARDLAKRNVKKGKGKETKE